MYGSGLPDVVTVVNGQTFWVEFKRPGGRLTGQQRQTLRAICKAGGKAFAFVAQNIRVIDVQDPANDFNTCYTLRKTDGKWKGLEAVFGLPDPIEIPWP